MFGQKFYPYSTLQELNLDWILTKVKNILRFVPDDGVVGQILRRTPDGAEWSNETGGGGAVDSVNGQTGTVVLTASDVGALPDTYTAPVTSVNTKTGAVVLDKTDIGLSNVANVAQYSASNPPPYPVTSVNGQTGDVIVQGGGSALDAYPVGSIYMSVNNTSPATLFGGGTWIQLKDRFLLGAGDTYTAGDTGGEAEHTLIENELPKIEATANMRAPYYSGGDFKLITGTSGHFTEVQATTANTSSCGSVSNNTKLQTLKMSFGNNQSHNNMPPYLVIYMWQRTA